MWTYDKNVNFFVVLWATLNSSGRVKDCRKRLYKIIQPHNFKLEENSKGKREKSTYFSKREIVYRE